MHSEPGEVGENLKKIREFSLNAASNGAHIVCFPELSVTGYLLKDPIKGLGGFSFDYIVDSLVRIADESSNLIIAGLVEPDKEGRGAYIAQVVIGANGIIGIYRKTHLSPLEKNVYLSGNELLIHSIDKLSFGIQLCYEAHFPEISTIMALMGAELIFIPHASPRGSPEEKFNSWMRHLKARAFDNGLFVVSCNQVGKTRGNFAFPGVAIGIGPDGEIIDYLLTEKEDMLLITIDKKQLSQVRNNVMRYFLPHRRPELYARIFYEKKRHPLS